MVSCCSSVREFSLQSVQWGSTAVPWGGVDMSLGNVGMSWVVLIGGIEALHWVGLGCSGMGPSWSP